MKRGVLDVERLQEGGEHPLGAHIQLHHHFLQDAATVEVGFGLLDGLKPVLLLDGHVFLPSLQLRAGLGHPRPVRHSNQAAYRSLSLHPSPSRAFPELLPAAPYHPSVPQPLEKGSG